MRTRDKSKAQLLRELITAESTIRLHQSAEKRFQEQVERLKEQVSDRDAQITLLREKLDTRAQEYQHLKGLHEKKCGEVITLEGELREVKAELQRTESALNAQVFDLRQELNSWKGSYKEMASRMKEMRKSFYQQAALAGKLAENAYATVAHTMNAEEAR